MVKLQSCLLVLFSTILLTSTMIQKLHMPDGLQSYFNSAKIQHNISDITGEQIFWECMQRVMWQMAEEMGHNITRETRDYLNQMLRLAVDSAASQFPRIRKDYRMLTDEERDRFHKALKGLKEDKTLKPNVLTAIAELHAGDIIPMAHFGAGFPGWHRVFLLIFETALRMKDPAVSIPYWASNLDAEMEDPTKSIIWSDQFLGNGDGFVTTGPFSDFKVYSMDSVLTRNIGGSGSLMTNEGIHNILSRNHTEQIVSPGAPHKYNLELQHNTVHLWIGGNMEDLSTSAEDPVFFLHHSFIDYLWEEFRTRQKMMGIDPETDYPKTDYGDKKHAPDSALGFGDLRNVDALSNVLADMVKYEPMPVCTRTHPTCISKYLRCDVTRSYPLCVSLSREEVQGDSGPETEICVEAQLTRAVQNTFAINQYCDIRKWAYIPVNIVLQRPPEFVNYKAYPVFNNRPVTTADVFSTISINKTLSKSLAAYPNCKLTSSVARKIYVESYGLNYYGKYKDFTILDQRHALSSATTYLGVKSPDSNFTDVIVYAFDYCGRTCRPFCLDTSTNPPKSSPCSGVIRITPDAPKMYGENYAEAVNGIWSAEHPDDLPEATPHPGFITFYCDYSGVWPWDRDIQTKHSMRKKVQAKQRTVKPVLREAKSINNIVQKMKQKTKQKQNVSNASNILRKKPRTITLIKKKRPVTPAPIVKRKPKVMVIDLSSVTSRPSTAKRQQQQRKQQQQQQQRQRKQQQQFKMPRNNFNNVNNRRNTHDRRQLLPDKRLFMHRNVFQEFQQFQQPRQTPQRGTDRFRFQETCRLNSGCHLPVPCSPCPYKSRQRCRSPSRLVAICVNGIYMLEPMVFNFMG